MAIVSVIVPAWRAEGFIARAIASARAQTLSDIEIIVIDDASPDATAEAAVRAGDGDPRVQVLRLARNGGAGAARNAGFRAAKGVWLAVLDADDSMAPNRLETLVAAGAGADIVADDMRITGDPDTDEEGPAFLGLKAPATMDLAGYALTNRLFKGERQSGYLKPMFRAAFLGAHALEYDESLRLGEDYALVASALAAGARFALHPEPLYRYRVRPGSVSRVMTGEDVASLLAADDRFHARFGPSLSPRERAALARRRASLERAQAFLVMVEALKARRPVAAAAAAWRNPQAALHFTMPARARLRRAFARGAQR